MPTKRPDSRFWQIVVTGIRRSSGTADFDAAKALEGRLNLEAWKQDKMGAKPKRSWQEAVERWCKERASKKSLANDVQYFLWWHEHFSEVDDLNLITRELVDAIVQQHRPVDVKERAPANTTANKYVSAVSGVLSAAEREWAWGNTAPVLRFYDEPGAKDLCPDPAQVRKLVRELPIHSSDVALYAVSTMHRRANVTGLTWPMVNFEMQAVKVAGQLTKNGQPIYVPLNPTALEVLRQRQKAPGRHKDLVFHYRGEPIFHVTTAAWHKAAGRAGIEGTTLHTLRHCANSWLAQKGVPREIRARLGGWSLGGDAIDGYTHLFIDHLRPFTTLLHEILAYPLHEICTTTRIKAGVDEKNALETGVADGIRTHNNQNHNLVRGRVVLH